MGVVMQATHVLLAVSQKGLRPEQVVSSTHATQLCVVVSQAGPRLLPTQLALPRHSTQVFVAPSQ